MKKVIYLLSGIMFFTISCTKEKRIPWVKTIEHTPANITNTSATLEGEVKATGWEDVTEKGIALGLTKDFTTPTLSFKSGNGEGEFVVTATGLTPDQTYYYKAYAVNKIGTRYGMEYSFKTKAGGTPPPPPPPPTSGDTIVDVDGNKYKIVTIGGQVWMQQNLRVERYRNGDPIPNVTVNAQWALLNTGAFCWESNDPSRDIPYGKLYNFYAVEDPRGICPVGWRVGTDNDWKILETTAGMPANELNLINVIRGENENVGGKLKMTSTWATPNNGATNQYSFNLLPGAYRAASGVFYPRSNGATLWTGSDNNPYPWNRGFTSEGYGAIRSAHVDKKAGLFVRCLKE